METEIVALPEFKTYFEVNPKVEEIIKETIKEVQEAKGRPVFAFDIQKALLQKSHPFPFLVTRQHLMKLVRTDQLYVSKNVNQFSVTRYDDTFQTFSEKFRQNRPGYTLDSEGLIRAKTAETLSNSKMIELFLSKDLSQYEANKHLFEGGSKFLDGKEDVNGNRVTYLTFPRCGSTFLRK